MSAVEDCAVFDGANVTQLEKSFKSCNGSKGLSDKPPRPVAVKKLLKFRLPGVQAVVKFLRIFKQTFKII
ncbi:MAG: hypothetical protein KME29_00685 [Calothrix sp. FI2-JRJ7]|nr:hypothetical protein [Calothrix sp. FI2-JRJ7]